MRYVLLIHGDEAVWTNASDAERGAMYADYGKLAREMEEHGHLRGADELISAAGAKIVRVRDGETLVADGPFTETKEQLGGYFVVECDLETALGYAARIPDAALGAVEVRPVVEDASG
jgi:hypothetical protein